MIEHITTRRIIPAKLIQMYELNSGGRFRTIDTKMIIDIKRIRHRLRNRKFLMRNFDFDIG
jgi:hypothetical protein